jgi:hypothetical protein
MKLLAIPIHEFYDNTQRYGPQLSAIPHMLSRYVTSLCPRAHECAGPWHPRPLGAFGSGVERVGPSVSCSPHAAWPSPPSTSDRCDASLDRCPSTQLSIRDRPPSMCTLKFNFNHHTLYSRPHDPASHGKNGALTHQVSCIAMVPIPLHPETSMDNAPRTRTQVGSRCHDDMTSHATWFGTTSAVLS